MRIAENVIDASPYLDFLSQEMADQELFHWDPDLSDHRSGDLFVEYEEEDDWS